VTGIRTVLQDITERKRAEEALAGERTLLRTVIDLLPDYIYVKDTQSRFLLSNEACARLMGEMAPTELIGKPTRILSARAGGAVQRRRTVSPRRPAAAQQGGAGNRPDGARNSY